MRSRLCGSTQDVPWRWLGSVRSDTSSNPSRTLDVASLGYRDDSPCDPGRRWSGPRLERVGDELLTESAIRVCEKDPGVVVECFLELGDVAVVESVHIQLNDSNDGVVIRRTSTHFYTSFS